MRFAAGRAAKEKASGLWAVGEAGGGDPPSAQPSCPHAVRSPSEEEGLRPGDWDWGSCSTNVRKEKPWRRPPSSERHSRCEELKAGGGGGGCRFWYSPLKAEGSKECRWRGGSMGMRLALVIPYSAALAGLPLPTARPGGAESGGMDTFSAAGFPRLPNQRHGRSHPHPFPRPTPELYPNTSLLPASDAALDPTSLEEACWPGASPVSSCLAVSTARCCLDSAMLMSSARWQHHRTCHQCLMAPAACSTRVPSRSLRALMAMDATTKATRILTGTPSAAPPRRRPAACCWSWPLPVASRTSEPPAQSRCPASTALSRVSRVKRSSWSARSSTSRSARFSSSCASRSLCCRDGSPGDMLLRTSSCCRASSCRSKSLSFCSGCCRNSVALRLSSRPAGTSSGRGAAGVILSPERAVLISDPIPLSAWRQPRPTHDAPESAS
mmetsp:Transcript_1237/g.2893  ORF Transcript_1237/g.2893 Transcript_1237/m.2893 type:complete len:439 (+) Transcript_1237:1636-2952(+)